MKPLRVFPPPRLRAGASSQPLPFPFDADGVAIYSRARHGLWAAARALRLDGTVVLAPAYHHGSEIEALVRAGAECRFYEATPDLAPDPDELEGLLDAEVRALLLVHTLGFPQDSPRWRAWCDERDLLLIEDCAQAWLASIDGQPVGSWGDAVLYCLYKTVGVPDGAAIIVRGAPLEDAPGFSASGRFGPALVRSSVADRARSRLGTGGSAPVQAELDLGDPTVPAAAGTSRMLPRLVRPAIPSQRREHYAYLLGALGEWVPAPFDAVPNGACPMALPMEVDDREGLLRELAKNGIEPLAFWSDHHPLFPAKEFPGATQRRKLTVAVPLHQDLARPELERVASVCESWLRRDHRSPMTPLT